MLRSIQDTVLQLLPARRKRSPSGWISFNAPCCVHNGETQDTRSRGGVMSNPNGSLSYHCFNCNFKASYVPGRHLSYKFRKLLNWLGTPENEIKRLVIDAIRVKDLVAPEVLVEQHEEVNFKPRALPEEARTLFELLDFYILNDGRGIPAEVDNVVEYIKERDIDFSKYKFY